MPKRVRNISTAAHPRQLVSCTFEYTSLTITMAVRAVADRNAGSSLCSGRDLTESLITAGRSGVLLPGYLKHKRASPTSG